MKSTPITYYGGKQNMVRHILPLIPPHRIYCEPFFGGGAVYWAKERSRVEVINDLSDNVVNFYRVMQSNFDALEMLVRETLISRSQHRRAAYIYEHPDEYDTVTRAWAFWVQCNLSFGAQPLSGWGYANDNTLELRLSNKKEHFHKYRQRIEMTQIECNDALKVIAARDTDDTFHYVDPPYVSSNCGHYDGYTRQDFVNLLTLLSSLKGKWLLSSYPEPELAEFREQFGWTSKVYHQHVAVTGKRTGAKMKSEVLTYCYEPNQRSLF